MRIAHNKIALPRDELEHLYVEEHLSSNEIARRFGCDGLTVRARLHEYGIALRPRGWHKLVRCVPDGILNTWPSAQLAYVVGLIASDGNLQKQNNCVILVSTDRELIDSAAEILQLDNPNIIESKPGFSRKPAFMLQICDYVFREFLEARGLTPNKTMTIGQLDIPDVIFMDFLRGELDGDGGWHIAKGWRDFPYLVGKFTSRSQRYLEWIHWTVLRLAGIDGRLHQSRLFYNGKKAEALGQWLYHTSDLPCLQRKRNIWQSWMTRTD